MDNPRATGPPARRPRRLPGATRRTALEPSEESDLCVLGMTFTSSEAPTALEPRRELPRPFRPELLGIRRPAAGPARGTRRVRLARDEGRGVST